MEEDLRVWKRRFLILLFCSVIIIGILSVFSLKEIRTIEYCEEMGKLSCNGFNACLDFARDVYPNWIDQKCEEISIMINNSERSDILCKTLKRQSLPEENLKCEDVF